MVTAQQSSDHVMAVLCDLAFTIGEADDVSGVLAGALQKLLYHTGFAVGLAVRPLPPPTEAGVTTGDGTEDDEAVVLALDAVIGDAALNGRLTGSAGRTTVALPPALLPDHPTATTDASTVGQVETRQTMGAAICLPVPGYGHILLLSPGTANPLPALLNALPPALARMGAKIDHLLHREALTESRLRILSEVVEQNPASIVITDPERMDRIIRQTIDAFTEATIHTDPYTAGHEVRVTHLCQRLGERLGLDSFRRTGLEIAARCHDIGQIKVPAEILLRPRALTPIEFKFVKLHATVGWEILRSIDFPWPVAEIVHQHHENMDGTGYPQGLTGESILLEARILRVADLTESLASHRPFRQAYTPDEVTAHLRRNRGTILDAAVTDACLAELESGYEFPPPDLNRPGQSCQPRLVVNRDTERAII